MTDSPLRDNVEEVAKRLLSLYQDKHPGLMTWRESESNLLWELSGALHDAGICKMDWSQMQYPKKELEFAGADWVERSMRVKNMSRIGRKVADILGVVYAGIYHIDQRALDKVDWTHKGWIEIKLRDSLSTWDFNRLTALVIACHDAAVRVEIDGNSWHMLLLRFHERKRRGDMFERHPTIEDVVTKWRERFQGALLYENKEEEEDAA